MIKVGVIDILFSLIAKKSVPGELSFGGPAAPILYESSLTFCAGIGVSLVPNFVYST